MSETCKMVFLDEHGKPSAFYESALKKYGPKKAKELYIKKMLNSDVVRYSKEEAGKFTALKELRKESDALALNEDNVYVDSIGAAYSRVSNVSHDMNMKENKADKRVSLTLAKKLNTNGTETYDISPYKAFLEGKSDAEALGFILSAEAVAKRRMVAHYMERSNISSFKDAEAEVMAIITADNKTKGEDPDFQTTLHKFTKDVFKSWEASTEYGTIFHEVMEDALNYRNQLIEEGEDPMVYNNPRLITLHMDTQHKDFLPGKFKAIQGVIETVIKEANEFSKSIGGKKVVIETETKLKTSKLVDQNGRGIAGTADLLFISEDNDVMVYDYKTKSEESVKNFEYASSDKMGGPWKDYANNAKNKAQAQISIYGAMLQEKGFNVVGGKVIMVPGEFRKVTEKGNIFSEDIGELEWKLVNLDASKVEVKTVNVMSDAVTHYFKGTSVEDSANIKIHNAVKALSGGKMELERENLETFIRTNWHKQYDPKAKEWFIRAKGGEALYMKQWSDSQAREFLTKRYQQIKDKQRALPIDVVQYFYNREANKKLFGSERRRQINELLSNISPDTHELFRAKDFNPQLFGAIGDDALVAVDKRTGSLSFYSVLSVSNNKISFESESGSRTSIYGNFITDKEVRKSGVSEEMLVKASTHEYVRMKLALGALNYIDAHKGINVNIDSIRVGSIGTAEEKPISFTTLDIEKDRLNKFRKYAGDDFDPEIAKLLDRSKPIKYSNLEYVNKFLVELKNGTGPLEKTYGKTDYIGTLLKDKLEEYENGSELPEFNVYSDEFKDALMRYRRDVYNSLEGTEEARYDDPGFKLINKACLEVLGFDLSSRQVMVDSMGKSFMRAAKNSGDYYAQHMHNYYEKETTRLREKFVKFDKEHQKLLKDALRESGKSLNSMNLQHLFDELYIDSTDPADLMRLKDPSDPSLKPAQKAYIEFFNKHVKDALILASDKKEYQKGIQENSTWTEGYVPIKKRNLNLRNENSYRSMKTFMKALTPNTREPFDPQLTQKFDYSYGISDQSTDSGIQHSETRRKALNIGEVDEQGNPIPPDPNISRNLADILTTTVMGGYKQEHLGRAVQAYSALDGFLAELAPTLKTSESREFLGKWAELVLHNRVKNEKYAKHMDIAKKYASTFLFAGNVKQFGTEFFTGAINSTGSMIANGVQKFLSKGKAGRFNMADWGWAVAQTTKELDPRKNSLVYHMIIENGMFGADPEQLQSSDYTRLDRVDFFSSKAMYGLNHMFFNSSITSTFLAEMKNKGIVDTYVNKGTKEDPEWVYDETKDKRFYIYDPARGIGVAPSTDEERKKLALYQATRKEAMKEGLVNEDGSLKFPLTSKQRSEIKQYATRLYGSFGKDALTAGQYTAVGRAFGAFKSWFMQKGVNYWNSSHIDDMYGEFKWVDDPSFVDENGDKPGGYYRWEGEMFEGILQSTARLLKDIATQGTNTKLSKIQKENLSKLLTDLFWLLMLHSITLPFFEDNKEFTDSATGQNVKGAIMNAMGESNIAKTALSMTDNAIPVVSLATNAASRLFNTITALGLGDLDKADDQASKLFNLWGAGKTINTLEDIVSK